MCFDQYSRAFQAESATQRLVMLVGFRAFRPSSMSNRVLLGFAAHNAKLMGEKGVLASSRSSITGWSSSQPF